MPAAKKREIERRRTILDAARFLFLRNGLRGTTMEAIARQAQIAKPTLYAHFVDKFAIFDALLEQLVSDKLAAFDMALQQSGPIEARIISALAAKHEVVAELVAGSPHADELFAAHHRGAELFAEAERRIERRLMQELRDAGIEASAQLARILLALSSGLGDRSVSGAGLKEDIALGVTRLLGPALGDSARAHSEVTGQH